MYFNGRESGPDFNFNRDICKGVEEFYVNVVDLCCRVCNYSVACLVNGYEELKKKMFFLALENPRETQK